MTKRSIVRVWPLAVVVCVLGLGALFLAHQPPVAAQDQAVRPMFEYRVLYQHQLLELDPKDSESIEGALNKLGEEGWELINVTLDIRPTPAGAAVVRGAPAPRENRFYFKRRK